MAILSSLTPWQVFCGRIRAQWAADRRASQEEELNEVVEDLFKGAREHGAVPLDRSGKGPGESSKARVS